jgi:DNA-binding beta-propeller fold protein YncE
VVRRLLTLLAFAGLAGCAGVEPAVLHMDPGPARAQPVFFPPAPDVPRYFYAGQLIGERNYRDGTGGSRSTAASALRWIAGIDEAAQAPLELQRPHGGTVDARGRVLVSDASRQAVVAFGPDGLETWEDAGEGRRFAMPVGIAASPEGRIWVADADLGLVIELDGAGKPRRAIGAGKLVRPTGLAYDAISRSLFVVDTYAHDVKVFTSDGTLVRTIGQRGEEPGEFNFPTHAAVFGGELYVSDTMNARVQVLATADGAHRRTIGERGLYIGNLVRPKGVAVDSEGNTYVVESYYDHLLVYDPQGRFLMGIGGVGRGVGNFYLPSGVWTDARNRVFVGDMFNGRVVVLQYIEGGAREQ